MTALDLDAIRRLCASIAERIGPNGDPDALTLLAAMSDTLAAFERERREHAQWAFEAGQATGEHLRERDDEIKAARAEVERLRAALQVCEHVLTRAEPTDDQLHAGQQAAGAPYTDWTPERVWDDLPDFKYPKEPNRG